jgi:hypothetical protein
MKKTEPEAEDDLRPEYDLKNLRLRKLGRGRRRFAMREELVDQFCRKPNGERVIVESILPAQGDRPERAVFRYIEGPKEGERGIGTAADLEPLGLEISKDGTEHD